MRSPIFTLEEIQKRPEFGGNVGWFYGLVRHHETGKIGLYEIFPGLGYAGVGPLTSFKTIWLIIKDIYWATKHNVR